MRNQDHSASRPKTRQEIARELKISARTLSRKLIEKNIILPSGLVCPEDQKKIYNAFWYPNEQIKLDIENI